MENEAKTTETPEAKINVADEVKKFYKGDFKEIFITFFKNPIDGIFSVFQKPSEKAYLQSLILFASVFVLYLVGGYILAGDMRSFLDFGVFFKISLIPAVMMFMISVLSFGIKSVSGKPNFKNELLTGGLCAIPLGLLIPLLLVIKMFASVDNVMRLAKNPAEGGAIGGLFFFYIILMLINIFQQSLKASGTKDALAWYLSPAAILLSMYLTFKVSEGIF